MRTILFWASPNQDGLTAAAKDRIVQGISDSGAELDVVHLNACDIQRCRTCENGWGICRSEGRCIIEDDFAELYERIRQADGVVWVTPVYWHDLAECLKTFLDRLRRCETRHNHFLKGKKCLLVACAGGSGNGAVECLDHLEKTLNHMEMEAVDRLPIIQFNKGYMLPALEKSGEAFAACLKQV